jgi:hypothetical protein
MTVTRTTFKCGHRGFGSFCHRCRQAELLEARIDLAEASRHPGNEDVPTLRFDAAALRSLLPLEEFRAEWSRPKAAPEKETVDG